MAERASGPFGPRDRWPTHTDPGIQASLERLRAAGWWLYPASAHAWGSVRCRPKGEEGGYCEFDIFSTGKSNGWVPREMVRMLDRCGHVPEAEVEAAARADEHINKGDQLVSAARALVDLRAHASTGAEAWLRATEMLDAATYHADEVEILVALAEQKDREAELSQREYDAAMRMARFEGEPRTATQLLSGAGHEADLASEERRGLHRPSLRQEITQRVSALRSRIEVVRHQIWEERQDT